MTAQSTQNLAQNRILIRKNKDLRALISFFLKLWKAIQKMQKQNLLECLMKKVKVQRRPPYKKIKKNI